MLIKKDFFINVNKILYKYKNKPLKATGVHLQNLENSSVLVKIESSKTRRMRQIIGKPLILKKID